MNLESPLTGVVVEVVAGEGAAVAAGAPVLVLESMKMHQEVTAPVGGVVRDIAVGVGDQVDDGQVLLRIEAAADGTADPGAVDPIGPVDLDHVREDLRATLDRRAKTLDAARPDAVARRHDAGHRTARENIEALVDEGSFVEYGGLAIAAQRGRRSVEELIDRTPADGIVTGIGTVGGHKVVVLAYDYTVLAGTQGIRNHRKTDRMLEIAERLRLPVVLFADGGGGRPGDTDSSELFHLVVPTFGSFARLSGLVPRVGIVTGNCFAGNAALLGCCDVIVATPDASIGMGGPAMIEGGGLGVFQPEEVGPADMQTANGVIDLLVDDDAAAVDTGRTFLGYFTQPSADWRCADQRLLRSVVPEDPKRVHDVRRLLEILADDDSVMELRRDWGQTMLTALARIEGRPVGVIANDPRHLAGAIDSDGSDKAARFMQLCDAFAVPLLSLVDTPGFMVGPQSEATAAVRHTARLFTTGATVGVPFVSVVVRRAFGLGAQAMTAGSMHAPELNVAWPSAEFGAMGVEGAVRLAMRRELEAIEDEAEREARVRELVAAVRAESTALNMASYFEVDDVIDPAETRAKIAETLRAAPPPPPLGARRRTMIDPW